MKFEKKNRVGAVDAAPLNKGVFVREFLPKGYCDPSSEVGWSYGADVTGEEVASEVK